MKRVIVKPIENINAIRSTMIKLMKPISCPHNLQQCLTIIILKSQITLTVGRRDGILVLT